MFDRKNIRTHHEAINALISKYCEENGLVFNPATVSFTDTELNYKCRIQATDANGNAKLDPWEVIEIKHLIKEGNGTEEVLNADTVLGRNVHLINGKTAKILGYNHKRPKYCWRIEMGGKTVLVSNHMIMWHKGFAA